MLLAWRKSAGSRDPRNLVWWVIPCPCVHLMHWTGGFRGELLSQTGVKWGSEWTACCATTVRWCLLESSSFSHFNIQYSFLERISLKHWECSLQHLNKPCGVSLQHLVTGKYFKLFLCLFFLRNNARYLWKRIPPAIKSVSTGPNLT